MCRGDDPAAVGTEADAGRITDEAAEGAELLAGGRVPELDGRWAFVGCQQATAVGMEGDGRHAPPALRMVSSSSPVVASQTRAVRSVPHAEASWRPSGLNARSQ